MDPLRRGALRVNGPIAQSCLYGKWTTLEEGPLGQMIPFRRGPLGQSWTIAHCPEGPSYGKITLVAKEARLLERVQGAWVWCRGAPVVAEGPKGRGALVQNCFRGPERGPWRGLSNFLWHPYDFGITGWGRRGGGWVTAPTALLNHFPISPSCHKLFRSSIKWPPCSFMKIRKIILFSERMRKENLHCSGPNKLQM